MEESGELPEGVLSINETALGTIEGGDSLDVAMVMLMWRRARASAALVADNIGRRLENLTWRILRSERVRQNLSGSRLVAHVMAIQEGGNIRTTPRASPRSSILDTYYTAAPPRNPTSLPPTLSAVAPLTEGSLAFTPIPVPQPEPKEDDEGTPTPTPSSPCAQTKRVEDGTREKRRSNLGRPPPILKNAGSSGSSRSASWKSPAMGTSQMSAEAHASEPSENPEKSPTTASPRFSESTGSPSVPRYVSTRFSEQVTVSTPHVPKSSLGGKGERSSRSLGEGERPRKKDHVVYAGSGAGRKRPIVRRQRSSQTPSSGKASPTSPQLGTQQSLEIDDDDEPTMVASTERRRAVSPDGRTGKSPTTVEAPPDDYEEPFGNPTGEENTRKRTTKEHATIGKSASSLVEPEWRAKLADRTQTQHRSFTNLPSAAWKSTTLAPTAASYQASGMMFPEQATRNDQRGSVRAAFHDEIVPLKAPAPAGPGGEDDADDVTPLPRTKSQLTLLLERDKSAGQNTKGRGPR